MTAEEIDRLEAKARDLTGRPLSTPIALTPRQVLELCRMARMTLNQPNRGMPA